MSIEFKESLKVIPAELAEDKIRKIDAYKVFLSETMLGYVEFMEALNNTITYLEINKVIGKTSLKSRVKAVNSALINTDEKTLDDIFGFEIVAENERDKEILMLLIHNLFVEKYVRQKNHNKSNGYFAHHCTGTVKNELDGTEGVRLEEHILDAQTNELKTEYRDLPIKEQKKLPKSEIFGKKLRYPILRREILENGKIDSSFQGNIENALKFFYNSLVIDRRLRKNIPIVEMQFKTKDVEQEAKHGKAQHFKYKKVNEYKILQVYYNRKLVRGVNFPFTFFRNEKGNIEIEHTSQALINMWPFIEDAVTHTSPVANYDMFFAKVFPGLEPYVERNLSKESSIPTEGYNSEMAWAILKNKIINDSFVLPEAESIKKAKSK